MPECRVELFADATDYDPIVVIGEIAHVAAVADDGPHASARTRCRAQERLGNLMLLCQNCHARIDGQTGFYTVARLQDVKQSHEAWVRASLPERGRSRTGWIALALRGNHPVDLATAAEALSPDFIINLRQVLEVPTNPDDWQAVDGTIAAEVRRLLAQGDAFDQRIAVFPLAPVSACISLGYHLTSRPTSACSSIIAMKAIGPGRACRPRPKTRVTGVDGSPASADAVTFCSILAPLSRTTCLPRSAFRLAPGLTFPHPGAEHRLASAPRPNHLGRAGSTMRLRARHAALPLRRNLASILRRSGASCRCHWTAT